MFQFFRRRDTLVRWFLGSLLVLVCVMLVVTLIPGLSAPSATDDAAVLATLAGQSITSFDLQRQFQQISRANRSAGTLAAYAEPLLDQMVTERAGLYEARRMGLQVSANELAEQLRLNPGIFPGGQFIGNDRYQDLVEQRFGMSVAQFEEKFRESLLTDKLRRVLTDGAMVTDAEVDREHRRRNDKLKLDYALLKSADFTAQVQVTDADLKGFFDPNRKRYSIPEKRRVKFFYVDQTALRERLEVSEQELRRFYEQNRDRYRVEDRAQVSHILLKTVGKTPQQAQELEKKAGELLAKARAGEDFAALARQHSEDTGTQSKGGELGWVGRGQTVPEFEKAAFSLEPGRISEVIKTDYGLHILKVTARERAHQQTLEDVRAQVLAQVKQQKGERAAQEVADRAQAALRRNPKNIAAVGAELKLTLLEVPEHQRGGALPYLGLSPAFDEAAFRLPVGEVSELMSVVQGVAALSVEQVIPQRPAELSEVRAQVEQDYRLQKASQLVLNRARELADRARSLGDLKKAARDAQLTAVTSEPMTRDGSLANVGPIASFAPGAFQMKVGEVGGPVPVAGGDTVLVYALAEKLFSTPEEAAKNRDSLRSQLLDQKRNVAFQLFLENLKDRLKREGRLRINESAMKRFTGSLQP